MKEINLKVKSVNVEVKSRKLRYDYSREMLKDLNSFHNLDFDYELEKILYNELRATMRKKKIENLTKHSG
jgi:hypothetical protein